MTNMYTGHNNRRKKTHLVVFFNRRLEYAISFGIVERAVDHFVNRAPSEVSLGGSYLFVPIVVNMQNVVPYELLGGIEKLGREEDAQDIF